MNPKAGRATRFISLLERMILELRGAPTIIFGHHMNKGGVSGVNTDQSAARGSSALTDGVRQQFNLEKIKKEQSEDDESGEVYDLNTVTLRMVKSNFSAPLSPQKIQKNSSGCLTAATKKSSSVRF